MTSSKKGRAAALPQELQDALRRRLAGKGAPAATKARDAIPRADRSEPLPLSFAQQRLWFLDQLRPGDCRYNSAVALRLTGGLDRAALSGALDGVLERHEALRTTFDDIDGRPVQTVHPAAPVPLPVRDLTERQEEVPGGDGAGPLDALLQAEYSRPFDLRTGPLLRALLVRLADEEHVLLLTAHHIVTDGWSMGVLLDELCTSYDALAHGETPALAPVATQYPDFAVWQRGRLTGALPAEQLSYWTKQLDQAAPLELPLDRPRSGAESGSGAIHEFRVPPRTAARLRQLATEQHTTLFTALIAACQALFARWSGQDDIAVGSLTPAAAAPNWSARSASSSTPSCCAAPSTPHAPTVSCWTPPPAPSWTPSPTTTPPSNGWWRPWGRYVRRAATRSSTSWCCCTPPRPRPLACGG